MSFQPFPPPLCRDKKLHTKPIRIPDEMRSTILNIPLFTKMDFIVHIMESFGTRRPACPHYFLLGALFTCHCLPRIGDLDTRNSVSSFLSCGHLCHPLHPRLPLLLPHSPPLLPQEAGEHYPTQPALLSPTFVRPLPESSANGDQASRIFDQFFFLAPRTLAFTFHSTSFIPSKHG